jgi:NAD-dependent DNA ligase
MIIKPTPEQVRQIFRDTYQFYIENQEPVTDNDHDIILQEADRLQNEYPFELCKKILAGLIDSF